MEIRIRATGQVMYGEEFNRTICSLPITPELLEQYGADPVLEGPQATFRRWKETQVTPPDQRSGSRRPLKRLDLLRSSLRPVYILVLEEYFTSSLRIHTTRQQAR